jgi:hypothetical protein
MGCCADSNSAVWNGHLDCLKYLYSQKIKWSLFSTYCAVEKGDIECLKYLHSHGCEWHPYTTYHAVRCGNLDCLLYCLENECPIDHETLNKLYTTQIDKNLITNLLLRKILTHKRLKDDITVEKYPEFYKLIQDYQQFITKFHQFIESETNIPTDVIKYEIMKYI